MQYAALRGYYKALGMTVAGMLQQHCRGADLVGYGLDCEEKYRTLPAVYELTGC